MCDEEGREESRFRSLLLGFTVILTLLFAGCGSQEPSSFTPSNVRTIALNNPTARKALALLKQSGAQSDWSREAVEQEGPLTVYTVPTTGQPGMLSVSLEKGKVVGVALTVADDKGEAVYLDLAYRYGLRVRVQDQHILESGRLPDLQALGITSILDIHFLPEEPLLPQGYYDPTGCVPDAMYEQLISASQAYQSARSAAEQAAADAAVQASLAAYICATAESGFSAPACIAASTYAAFLASKAAYLAYRAWQAAQNVERIRRAIEERIQQCQGSLEQHWLPSTQKLPLAA